MGGLFISYRREDCQGWAGRLADAVKANFDEAVLFLDIESIKPGDDFVDSIEAAVGSCRLLLALIGPRWLAVADGRGMRRLDDPNDFVRLEIATAIIRKIRVIPILLGGATMPRPEELPPELISLARHQAHEITDKRWDYDCEILMNAMEDALGKPRKTGIVSFTRAGAKVIVADGLAVGDGADVGNIKGVVGESTTIHTIEVAKNARIKGKTGDIVGLEFIGHSKDRIS